MVAIAAAAAALLFVVVPRRWMATTALVLLACYFAAGSRPVESFTHQASVDAYNTIRSPRDWIDRAVGNKANVASLYWSGDQFRFWESEIFNRNVGPVYSIPGPYDGLPGLVHVSVDPSGLIRGTGRRPVTSRYVLTDVDTQVAGRIVAVQEDAGMVLHETSGPVIVRQRVDGLYPDRWSGSQVNYQRFGCEGGTAVATLRADPELHREPVPVTATVAGGEQRTIDVSPTAPTVFRVPLSSRRGLCGVTYTMPTVTPAEVSDSGDTRALGVRFRVDYEPPR